MTSGALCIHDFSATIVGDAACPRVIFGWRTEGATLCHLDGVDNNLAPNREGVDALELTVSPAHPLRSAYTLHATGEDGATTARTLAVRYAINPAVAVELDSAVAVRAMPDGRRVLVLGAQGVEFFDSTTLERLAMGPLTAPDSTGVDAFALAPDGATIFVISFGGRVYGFDAETLDVLPHSGAHVVGDSEPPYLLAASNDNRTLALVTNQAEIDNRLVGTNQLLTLDRHTFAPVAPSPIATAHTLIHVAGHRTGRHYLGTPDVLRVLDGATLANVWTADLVLPGMLALSPDERHVYVVSFDAASRSFVLSRLHADDGDIEAQSSLHVGFNPMFQALLGVPFAALSLSPDEALLFVLGAEPAALRRNQVRSTLLAFDARRLEACTWSPMGVGGARMPIAIDVSPDGSRVFVVAGERIGSRDSTSALLVADASLG